MDDFTYEYSIWGIIPVRIVVARRVDGWCAYALPKYMPNDWLKGYGDTPDHPVSFERVQRNGFKMLERFARELFPNLAKVPYID